MSAKKQLGTMCDWNLALSDPNQRQDLYKQADKEAKKQADATAAAALARIQAPEPKSEPDSFQWG